MNNIRRAVRDKQNTIGNDKTIGKDSMVFQYNSDIKQICSNQLSAKLLESKIDEMNLK